MWKFIGRRVKKRLTFGDKVRKWKSRNRVLGRVVEQRGRVGNRWQREEEGEQRL